MFTIFPQHTTDNSASLLILSDKGGRSLLKLVILLKLLKVFPRVPDVDQDGLGRDVTVGQDDHHVGVGREDVNEGGEVRVPHFHRLEVCCQLAAAQFELFDYIADLLESVNVPVLVPLSVRDH